MVIQLICISAVTSVSNSNRQAHQLDKVRAVRCWVLDDALSAGGIRLESSLYSSVLNTAFDLGQHLEVDEIPDAVLNTNVSDILFIKMEVRASKLAISYSLTEQYIFCILKGSAWMLYMKIFISVLVTSSKRGVVSSTNNPLLIVSLAPLPIQALKIAAVVSY